MKLLRMKKRVSTKIILEFLNRIADLEPFEHEFATEPMSTWKTKLDGGFLCFSGDYDRIKWLLKNGITEQLQKMSPQGNTVTIGFNPEEQKWYGWSHRASFGFGIGHQVKFGDSGFFPKDISEFIECAVNFYTDENHIIINKYETIQNGKLGLELTWEYTGTHSQKTKPILGVFCEYPSQWGKGCWTAQTLDEAKEMAIDFARSVS